MGKTPAHCLEVLRQPRLAGNVDHAGKVVDALPGLDEQELVGDDGYVHPKDGAALLWIGERAVALVLVLVVVFIIDESPSHLDYYRRVSIPS